MGVARTGKGRKEQQRNGQPKEHSNRGKGQKSKCHVAKAAVYTPTLLSWPSETFNSLYLRHLSQSLSRSSLSLRLVSLSPPHFSASRATMERTAMSGDMTVGDMDLDSEELARALSGHGAMAESYSAWIEQHFAMHVPDPNLRTFAR